MLKSYTHSHSHRTISWYAGYNTLVPTQLRIKSIYGGSIQFLEKWKRHISDQKNLYIDIFIEE